MDVELPEELPGGVLFRIVRGDTKGRPFGTPRNPDPPTQEEFNPRLVEVRVIDLANIIVGRRHGIHPDQAQKVSQLSNEDLIRFWLPAPISAIETTGGLSLTGGHHRTTEIIQRLQAGTLDSDTVIRILLHD